MGKYYLTETEFIDYDEIAKEIPEISKLTDEQQVVYTVICGLFKEVGPCRIDVMELCDYATKLSTRYNFNNGMYMLHLLEQMEFFVSFKVGTDDKNYCEYKGVLLPYMATKVFIEGERKGVSIQIPNEPPLLAYVRAKKQDLKIIKTKDDIRNENNQKEKKERNKKELERTVQEVINSMSSENINKFFNK